MNKQHAYPLQYIMLEIYKEISFQYIIVKVTDTRHIIMTYLLPYMYMVIDMVIYFWS